MRNRLMTALTAMPLAFASLPALAQTATDRPDYWHYGWEWGWGHMLFGSMMMILFWGGIIFVIVLATRWLGGRSSQDAAPTAPRGSALDIVEQRFARGDIDKEEFEDRKRLLSN